MSGATLPTVRTGGKRVSAALSVPLPDNLPPLFPVGSRLVPALCRSMAHAMVDGPLASTDADPFFTLNPHKEVKITPSGE